MIQTLSRIALIAAFAVSGAAYAQKANETSNTPQRAGEASTMTGGAPNAKTTNETTTPSPADKAMTKRAKGKMAKKGKSNMATATETSNTPQRAGEASTMTGGVPNKKTTN
jgi:hypothetical protein